MMKRLIKQHLLIVIIICLLFTTFVSCSSNNEDKLKNSTPIQTTVSDISTTAPAHELTPEPEPTSENKTVKPNDDVDDKIKVHFINVGQGDSIFIEAQSLKMLIDGGNRDNIALNYLKKLGVDSLDLVISTHPHADHIGGLVNVLKNIEVKEVIDPGVVHTSKTFEDYLTLIDEKDITFTEGKPGIKRDLVGGLKLELLGPVDPSDSNLNNTSIICKFTFGEISFLFTGDAEEKALNRIINKDIKSDILKVSHHGSNTGTTHSFVEKVNPKVAIIMVGEENSYGHPHDEALSILHNNKVDIYRTDLHGNIIITTNGQTFDINIKQPYQYNPPKVPEESNESKSITKDRNYVGSIESDKYHYPTCRYAKNIKDENEIWFSSIEEAKDKGYKACKVCDP